MKKTLLLLLSLLFAVLAHGQQTKWNYLEQQKTSNAGYELIKSSDSEIVVKFSQTAYGLRTVSTDKGDAYIVVPAKGSQIQKKGAPDLGKITQSIIIPNTNGMKIKVTDSKYVELTNVEIAPSKGVISRDKNPANISYEWGPEYQQNAFYPAEVAYLGDPYIIRDFRGQVIVTQPFQYNPVTKTLRIYKEIKLEVVPTKKAGINQLSKNKAASAIDPNFVPIYSRHFLNYTRNKYTSLPENGGKLLIITYDSFSDEMQSFVDWKNSIGVQTTMVNYSTIGSSSALKTYVENYYNSNGLTYLLIVGDNSQVSTSSTSAGDSDNNYGYIVGNDHYLDIFVGRFSAENATQVTTMIDRTIYYEKDMLNSSVSVTDGIGIASNEGTGGSGDDGESDEVHMNNIQSDLTNYGYSITKCYQDGGSTSALTSLINNGAGIINYVGHGSNTSWAAPSFSNSNVNALSNTNKFPFIFSVACVVGNFKSITCFAETWLRATDSSGDPTGAVVFCGSTINQSWASPMCAQDEMNDLLVADAFKSYGGIFVNGMFQMIDEYSSDGENMADTWTVFGDPSLQTRTPGHPDGPVAGDDTQAPTAPTNLGASDISTTTLTLNWTASNDNVGVTGYDVYRNGSLLTSTTGTTYNVTGLTAATSYSFYITAKDAAENVSEASSTINISTVDPNDTEAPTAPTNLASSNISATTVELSWTASTDNVAVTGYDVYKDGSLLVSVSTNSASITNLTANTSYSFYVTAKDGIGNVSQPGNTINLTTLPEEPDYCTSNGNDVSDEYIQRVQFGSIDNTSGVDASGYSDHTGLSTTIAPGSNYTITITPKWTGTVYSEGYSVWIDYNHNGLFTDAGEQVWTNAASKTTPVSGSFTVPAGATQTSTRMRVSMQYDAIPSDCGSFNYGEVEDYTVNISGVTDNPPTAPTDLSSSSITQTSFSLSWTASTDNIGVTGYDVYIDGSLVGSPTTTSYDATGLTAGTTYAVSVKAKDTEGNESSASNISVTTTPASCTDVTLTLIVDNYPEETSWTITNDGGSTVASGGTYNSTPDGSTVIETACLDAGCYTFTMNDSYGDGICCSYGSGSYELTEDGSGTSLASGGSFGSTATHNFCVGTSRGETTFKSVITESVFQGIKIHPNPVINELNVMLAKGTIKSMRIYSATGSLLETVKINENTLDVSHLSPGVYFINIETGQGVHTKKFIK